MTYKQMCETIVKAVKILNPKSKLTPKEVWEISPTGDLMIVQRFYSGALDVIAKDEEKKGNTEGALNAKRLQEEHSQSLISPFLEVDVMTS